MKTQHPALWSAGIGGAVGILVALLLAFLVERLKSIPNALLITLWPASILGFGYNGGGGLSEIETATAVLGGNALIYAVVASIIAVCFIKLRDLVDPTNKRPPSIKPK
jgi:hypothetical protein